MKNALRFTLLAAALSVALVACERPDVDRPGVIASGEREIIYTVGGTECRQTLATESEWDAMLEQLCDRAEEGSEVTFYNLHQTAYRPVPAKESRTINTASRDELKRWMKSMEKEGLTVRVSYDDATGTWRGEAYSTAPAENTLVNLLGTWQFNCMVVSQLDAAGHLQGSNLHEPEGGTMRYTFSADGTVLLEVNGMDGTTATDNGRWTLSADGMLSSELLPNGVDWSVNWITASTMVLSRSDFGVYVDDYHYQLQFESVTNDD